MSSKADAGSAPTPKKSSTAKTATRMKDSDKTSAMKSPKPKSKKGDSQNANLDVDGKADSAESKGAKKATNQDQSDVAMAKEAKKDRRFTDLTPEAKQARRREERQKRKKALSQANASAIAVTPAVDGDIPALKTALTKDTKIKSFKTRLAERPAIRAKREREKAAKAKEWRVSQPIGGRYSTNTLVYSTDEKYIFLAQGPSLKVFSNKTSLLYRTLQHLRPPATSFPYVPNGNYSNIANYTLDPSNPNQVYTITFGGELLLWDWTEGTIEGYWKTDLHKGQYLAWCGLCVYPTDAEASTNTVWTYHEYGVRDFNRKAQREIRSFNIPKSPKPDEITLTSQTIITTEDTRPRQLVIVDANTFVMDSGEAFYIGNKQKQAQESGSEWRIRKISSPGKILTIDAIVRHTKKGGIQGDVAIGDNSGQIFIYHDILNPHGPTAAQNVVKSKLHWHRTAVATLKYSNDGMFTPLLPVLSSGLTHIS